jgi:maltooligosyltrehalose synthase
VPRLIAGLDAGDALPLGEAIWKDTRVELPPRLAGSHVSIFTGETVSGDEGSGLRVADLFATFPVAILARSGD